MIDDEYTNDDGQTLQSLQTNLWHYRHIKNESWKDYWRNKSLERLLIARLAELDSTHAEIEVVEIKIEIRNKKTLLPIVMKKPNLKQKEST